MFVSGDMADNCFSRKVWSNPPDFPHHWFSVTHVLQGTVYLTPQHYLFWHSQIQLTNTQDVAPKF